MSKIVLSKFVCCAVAFCTWAIMAQTACGQPGTPTVSSPQYVSWSAMVNPDVYPATSKPTVAMSVLDDWDFEKVPETGYQEQQEADSPQDEQSAADDNDSNNNTSALYGDKKLPLKSITEIKIYPFDTNEIKPEDKTEKLVAEQAKDHWFNAYYPQKVYHWCAPNIFYRPLYFEDVALERYGQMNWGCGLQDVQSAVRFYGNFVFWLHNAKVHPPRYCDTPLGFCRPGSPTPRTRQFIIDRARPPRHTAMRYVLDQPRR